MSTSPELAIARNIEIHDGIARQYDARHGEIFNPVEQARLRLALEHAVSLVQSAASRRTALDVGCGSGNLSQHLLELGLDVIAADVSQGFLDLVANRFSGSPVRTVRLNGNDLSNVASDSCDMVATYSVLHHVPDYLALVAEMARVCAPGGVIFLDHEHSDGFWSGDPLYDTFRKEALRFDWRKYLAWENYVGRFRRIGDPRYSMEGDIHVWPDDHIEWVRIHDLLTASGFDCVVSEDYLLSRRLYRPDVYERYLGRCADMTNQVYRRRPAGPAVRSCAD